mmetsp:Transcript_12929/g.30664  ORF Transcript_12929/g.30664 Transcript_12929/m.30664 type:complete len:227 (-) Transcript_12929:234-914(-)
MALDLSIVHNDGRVEPLREHDRAAPHAIVLRHPRDPRGNLSHILRLPALRLGEGAGLVLVAEEEVRVREGLHQGRLERRHLHEERRREVQAIDLVVLAAELRHELHRLRGGGHEEAGAVHDLGVLNKLPVLRLLHVGHVELISRREVRDEGALAVLDAHAAGAGGDRVHGLVADRHAVVCADLRHLLGVLVAADAAHVRSGARYLKHPLRDADAVLRCTSSNVLDV